MKKLFIPMAASAVCILGCMAAPLFILGCQSTPQAVSYQVASTTNITVDQAIQAYDAFAKAGNTTIAQNQQVAAAYAKYQAAMMVVCDAGAAYSASSNTNASGATGAAGVLQAAVSNANQSITDLENLITSFGVPL